jgi:chromosome segregation protein
VAQITGILQEIRHNLQAAQVQSSDLAGRLALVEREEHDLARREEALRREQDQAAQRAEEARNRAAQIATEIAAAMTALSSAQDEIGAHRQQVDEFRRQEAELTEQVSQLRAQYAAEQRGRDEISRQRDELTARRDEWAAVLVDRRNELERYQGRLGNFHAEIAGLEESIRLAGSETGSAEKETERLALLRLNVAGVIGELEGSLRAGRRDASALHDQRGELEIHATQIRLRQENLSEKITQRYGLALAEFTSDVTVLHAALAERRPKNEPAPAGEPWPEVERVVAQLQEKLNSIGAVNVDAIQEFDELSQRNTFLETQRNDLTKSRDELQGIIAKINATTLELFTTTFERVRVNFQEMFTELFGGGRANLILADENDPLECGIEIVARPPGKQLQSVSLLSGGEKTMTAVALLFAIYMVKPSPFCVLDEMDAPLDESNIGRFIKVLDRFVQQSQFVVITHNKRTIARADVLYGVTMEQPGVSKPVAVRFTEHTERRGSNSDEPADQALPAMAT